MIANVVLLKSRSTAAVYAQVDRRLTVTVKVEVCHWRSAVLGNNKNNKNPFSLPRAGTTTLPSFKIKPSSQVTKWGARSERVNQKNKRTSTPSPSLSLNRHTAGTQPPSFFRFFFSRHTASLCILSYSSATVSLSVPSSRSCCPRA